MGDPKIPFQPHVPGAPSHEQLRTIISQKYGSAFSVFMAQWLFKALYAQVPQDARDRDAKAVVDAFRSQMRVLTNTKIEHEVLESFCTEMVGMLVQPLGAPKKEGIPK